MMAYLKWMESGPMFVKLRSTTIGKEAQIRASVIATIELYMGGSRISVSHATDTKTAFTNERERVPKGDGADGYHLTEAATFATSYTSPLPPDTVREAIEFSEAAIEQEREGTLYRLPDTNAHEQLDQVRSWVLDLTDPHGPILLENQATFKTPNVMTFEGTTLLIKRAPPAASVSKLVP